MAIFAAIEAYRVKVAGVDLTACLPRDVWFSASSSGPNVEGLSVVSGDLTLVPALGFDADFFNPRLNRNQWRRGNPVSIEFKSGGVWQHHPAGHLYITRRPATPSLNSGDGAISFTIPVGCEISLRLKDAPAGDASGVVIGDSNSRTDICGSIAAAANMQAAWVGTIPDYPIPYPVPKRDGVPWLEQAGEVAASAGYQLFINAQGELDASQISLNPSVIAGYSWRDVISLDAADGGEETSETVTATLLGQTVTDTPLSRTDTFVENGVILDLRTNFGGDLLVTGVKKLTTITEAWSPDYKIRTLTETVKEPFQKITGGNVSISPLSPRYIKNEIERYSSANDGKLLTRTTTISGRPDMFVFALLTYQAGGTPPPPQQLSIEYETWQYDGENVSTYTLDRDEYRFNVVSSGTFTVSGGWRRVRERKVTWQNLGGDTWRQIIDNRENINPTTIDLVSTGDSGITTKSDGSTAPRAPKRHDPSHLRDEVVYSGSAYFPEADLDDEPALYDFGPYGVSNEQAEYLASLWGGLSWGESFGYELVTALDDSYLKYRPGAGIHLLLQNGDKNLGAIGAIAWDCFGDQARVAYNLIDLGTIGTGNALLTPYPTQWRGFSRTKRRPTDPVITQFATDLNEPDYLIAKTKRRPVPPVVNTGGGPSIQGVYSRTKRRPYIDVTPPLSVLSIERGGTGANNAEQALKNLGIYLAGGVLTGTFPNPTLKPTGVTPGTYTSVTVGADGRVTAGT